MAATQAADLPARIEVIDTRRFAVWAAAFGSDERIGGGCQHRLGPAHRASTAIAAGVDFRVLPGTLVGVALAGGGADASLSGGLGSISADVFQAGLYGMTRFGSSTCGRRWPTRASRWTPCVRSPLSLWQTP